MYNDRLMDHFLNPRNAGELAEADAVGTIGDPECGDYMKVWMRVEGDRITAITFKCHGCPAAIATGSIMTEMALGRSLVDAARITDRDIATALGGIPDPKLHCSNLGAGALQQAILRYRLDRRVQNPQDEMAKARPGGASIYDRLRRHFQGLVDMVASPAEPVKVEARILRPEEAIGHPEDQDYPIIKGRERMVEASFRESRGHAFTDHYGPWEGTLADVLALPLETNFERSVFVSALNAVTRHVGIARCTVHCKDQAPRHCATEAEGEILKRHPGVPITLIGFQPRFAELVSQRPGSRIVDLDAANEGTIVGGIAVEGPQRTDEALEEAGLVMVTGSSLVNGTIERFLDLGKPTVFYGVTIAGAAELLRLKRFCPLGT